MAKFAEAKRYSGTDIPKLNNKDIAESGEIFTVDAVLPRKSRQYGKFWAIIVSDTKGEQGQINLSMNDYRDQMFSLLQDDLIAGERVKVTLTTVETERGVAYDLVPVD